MVLRIGDHVRFQAVPHVQKRDFPILTSRTSETAWCWLRLCRPRALTVKTVSFRVPQLPCHSVNYVSAGSFVEKPEAAGTAARTTPPKGNL